MFVLLAVTIASASFAQKGNGKKQKSPEERAQFQSQRMEKHLGLTAEQKTKVYDLCLTRNNKIKVVHDAASTTDQKKSELKTIHQEFRTGLQQVLTPEQWQKREDAIKKHQENKKNGKGKGKGNQNNSSDDDDDDELDNK